VFRYTVASGRTERVITRYLLGALAPVSTQAVAILRELHPLTSAGRFVFPGELASRTPEKLAAFIASLVFDAGPIGEEVRTFIVGDNLSETTASLKERIDPLRGSRRSHSRHRADVLASLSHESP
jgi:hypothetical protein